MSYQPESFIDKVKALGYHLSPENQGGFCYGLASMGMQAFMLDDLKTFDERYNFIMSFSSKELRAFAGKRLDTVIKKEFENWRGETVKLERTLGDVQAFLDGISLYQHPASHEEIFQGQKHYQDQIQRKASVLIVPRDDKKPVQIEKFSGAYNFKELVKYLDELSKSISVKTSMILTSSNHAVTLNFDPEKKEWFMINHGASTSKGMSRLGHENLAVDLIKAFDKVPSTAEHGIFATTIFTTPDNKETLEGELGALQRKKAWKKLHAIKPLPVSRLGKATSLIKAGITKKPQIDRKALARDGYGASLLQASVLIGDTETVTKLIEAGIDVNQVGGKGMSTPFIDAAFKGHVDILEALFEAGADINAQTSQGRTALHRAITAGHNNVVSVLVNHGIDVNIKATTHGETPLYQAISIGNTDAIKTLLSVKDIDVNIPNKFGVSPLLLAVRKKDKEVVSLLLEVGADVNQVLQDKEGLGLVKEMGLEEKLRESTQTEVEIDSDEDSFSP